MSSREEVVKCMEHECNFLLLFPARIDFVLVGEVKQLESQNKNDKLCSVESWLKKWTVQWRSRIRHFTFRTKLKML